MPASVLAVSDQRPTAGRPLAKWRASPRREGWPAQRDTPGRIAGDVPSLSANVSIQSQALHVKSWLFFMRTPLSQASSGMPPLSRTQSRRRNAHQPSFGNAPRSVGNAANCPHHRSSNPRLACYASSKQRLICLFFVNASQTGPCLLIGHSET
jgi:hypothetical protein